MIAGFGIGHHTADQPGWLTGTTVITAGHGAVGGVDVRGGGPGTRETDLLAPTTLVERVHAVVLTGGSAYGLAAADGVMSGLEEHGIGFAVGPQPGEVVPIVPSAVLFDLGRGGFFGHRPTAAFGRSALDAAGPEPALGCVGAGTGAVCGGIKGGFGYAETELAGGGRVGAAVAVNAAGSSVNPVTGRLWSDRDEQLSTPTAAEIVALREAAHRAPPSIATTIGAVLTDVPLSVAQASKVASVAHDGLARAVRPVHSMTDGDTLFCLSSGSAPALAGGGGEVPAINALLAAAADVVTDAIFAAMLAADSRGRWPSYTALAPSALG